MQQRDPRGYLHSLKASCEQIQRNDIVEKLDNLISQSPQRLCFSAKATLTNDDNLSFQENFETRADDERSQSNYSHSEGDSMDSSREGDYRSFLVTSSSEDSLKRFKAIQSDFKLRNYQLELAQPSIAGQNVIICSPTGSGKTVTAVPNKKMFPKIFLTDIAGTKCSVLIATDVVQEGMDYPKCNSVIRYNFVSNEIGTVQSRGRARAPDSQIFLIVDEGSINLKREIENLFRERKMLEVLDHLPDQEAIFQQFLDRAKTDLYGSLESEMKKEELKTMDSNKVTIHCKTCKQIMCSGSSIKKSPSGYISMDHDSIIKNTRFCKWSNVQNYKQNQHLGDVKCLICNAAVAVKINFKKNSNIYAYILIKEALSYKENVCMTYKNIPKTWDRLPFKIENLLDSQILR